VRSGKKASAAGQEAARASRLSPNASLAAVLADLEGLDAEGLRRQWRNHLGGEAPSHLPRWLLQRVLGHRLQVAAYGDLDKAVRRVVRAPAGGESSDRTAPFDRRDPQTREGIGLKPGALLVREWRGKLERVMVLDEGFAWSGATYRSLSQLAKAITGTSWNGHRFFGLRQNKDRSVTSRKRGSPLDADKWRSDKSGKRSPRGAASSAAGTLPPVREDSGARS
jgi:Protein of unknown function (DUF2924)